MQSTQRGWRDLSFKKEKLKLVFKLWHKKTSYLHIKSNVPGKMFFQLIIYQKISFRQWLHSQ